FVADKVRRQIGLGKLLILSIALESVGFVLPVLSPTPMMLIVAFFWVSAVGLFSNICIWSYRQEAFSQQHLGRIAGLTGSLFKLLMPFGLAASGYLVTRYGSAELFSVCFAVQFVVAIFLLFSRVRAIP
ncbi:MFS transporter, partial [Vibrio parahaemolyticus]|nr:MFS transporter [Vibrio parahaemolyticus]